MRRKNPPKQRRQRYKDRSDLSYVTINKQKIYLGKWGSEEADQNHRRIIAEWAEGDGEISTKEDDLLIAELIAEYSKFAKKKWKGQAHSKRARVIVELNDLYGDVLVNDFNARSLKVVRNHWIEKGDKRKTINEYTRYLKHVFQWAAENEYISDYKASTIKDVAPLGPGDAPGPDKVSPIPESQVNAIEDHISPLLWSLIQVQLNSGARPSELFTLRPTDINFKPIIDGQEMDDLWTVDYTDHKTARWDCERIVHFDEACQAFLQPLLTGWPIDRFIFDPQRPEAGKAANITAKRHRSHKYNKDSYRQAVHRACVRAEIPTWNPYQLRHTFKDNKTREHSLEVARVLMGHKDERTTRGYGSNEPERAKAAAALRKIG